MLARMWRKTKFLVPLVVMLTAATTGKQHWWGGGGAQKIKNGNTIRSSNSTTGYFPKKTKTLIWKDLCASMFIVALLTIVKIWKQPKCPLIKGWIRKMWYVCKNVCIHTYIYVCTYVYMYVYMHMYTYIHTYTQWNITQPSSKRMRSCYLWQHRWT